MTLVSVTGKGQVTIPKEVRQRSGIHKGSKIEFTLVGNHLELRIKNLPQEPLSSGFGMLKSQRPAVLADFDPVSLLGK